MLRYNPGGSSGSDIRLKKTGTENWYQALFSEICGERVVCSEDVNKEGGLMRRRRIKLEDAAKATLQHRRSIFRQRELARSGSHV